MTHPQLKRLKIHRYEEFVDVPWIEFSPHENLVLGINGAGKTRLLQLIRAVVSFNYEALLFQEFDVEFELTYLTSLDPAVIVDAHGRVRSDTSPVNDMSELRTHRPQHPLVSRLELKTGERDAVLTSDRTGTTLTYDGKADSVMAPPPAGYVIPWSHLFETEDPSLIAMWPGFDHFYVGEDARDFQSLSTAVRYLLGPKTLALPEDFGNLSYGWVTTLIETLTAHRDRAREGLQFTATDVSPAARGRHNVRGLPPIGPLLAALDAESINLRPKVVQAAKSLDCRGFEVRVKFSSGAEYSDDGLTFGQRRIIVMALMLLSNASYPALIDEIDNGLHPRFVEAALKLLSQRQSFLTSHNKLVIDYINYDSAEDIRRKIHICRRDASGRQTVDTLSEAVAQEVYEKISVGIMHPSDVLRVEGLW